MTRRPVMSGADKAVLTVYAVIFLFAGGMLFLMGVDDLGLGTAEYGWLAYLIGVIVLYRPSRRYRAAAAVLAVIRTAALIMMIGAYAFPVICSGFERNSGMYAAKRYVFINGVRETAGDLLPESIPEDAADYYFRTERQLLAQDYRPYAYLVMHTDRDFLMRYEADISQNERYERSVCDLEEERESRDGGGQAGIDARPEKLPRHVYDRLYNDAMIRDDLDGSVIFCGDDASAWNTYTGAMINYDTGLLVIWR
ncbi:MAG: hypothetical protein II695_05430 [Oscillospiraceae bacterium]|nr:hypothetical protein [Oscillospiraceae bacterium]